MAILDSVANRVILDFQDSVAKLVAKVAIAVTLDIRAILVTVVIVAKLVPAVIPANRGSVDILANQDSADLACLDILDSVATLDQAFRDFQDSVVPKVHRVFLAIQDSAVLVHQDIAVYRDSADILANQDLADLVSVDILVILVPRGYQDLVEFLDIVAKSVPVDLVDSAVPQEPMAHQASVDIVAIQDQAFRAIAGFLAPVASKVHRSILKAQWPIQLPCHRLGTIPMMPTLSIQMVIYTFGLALHGIMLAK